MSACPTSCLTHFSSHILCNFYLHTCSSSLTQSLSLSLCQSLSLPLASLLPLSPSHSLSLHHSSSLSLPLTLSHSITPLPCLSLSLSLSITPLPCLSGNNRPGSPSRGIPPIIGGTGTGTGIAGSSPVSLLYVTPSKRSEDVQKLGDLVRALPCLCRFSLPFSHAMRPPSTSLFCTPILEYLLTHSLRIV